VGKPDRAAARMADAMMDQLAGILVPTKFWLFKMLC